MADWDVVGERPASAASGGGWDVVSEKRQVGPIEAGIRGLAGRARETAGAVNSILQPAASLVGAGDWWRENMVNNAYDRAKQMQIDPQTETTGLGGRVAQAVGGLAFDMPAMLATGGIGEAAPAAATVGGIVRNAAANATKAMAVPAVVNAESTGRRVIEQGGTPLEAGKAQAGSIASTILSGAVPFNAPGGVLSRVVQGAATAPVSGAAGRAIENATLPNNMQQPYTAEDAAVSAITGGAMAGAMGPRVASRVPTPAEMQGFRDNAPPEPKPISGLLGFRELDPLISFPDGSVARKSELDAQGMPANATVEDRARLMGVGQQPADAPPPKPVLALPAPRQEPVVVDRNGVAGTEQARSDMGLTPDVVSASEQHPGRAVEGEVLPPEQPQQDTGRLMSDILLAARRDPSRPIADVVNEVVGVRAEPSKSEHTRRAADIREAINEPVGVTTEPTTQHERPLTAADYYERHANNQSVQGEKNAPEVRKVREGEVVQREGNSGQLQAVGQDRGVAPRDAQGRDQASGRNIVSEGGGEVAAKPPVELLPKQDVQASRMQNTSNVFERNEIEVGKPSTSRRKRPNGTDGETTIAVDAPDKVTSPDNWHRLGNTDAVGARVQARLDFASGKPPGRDQPVWSVSDRQNNVIARGLTRDAAIERAKDHVMSANPEPAPQPAPQKGQVQPTQPAAEAAPVEKPAPVTKGINEIPQDLKIAVEKTVDGKVQTKQVSARKAAMTSAERIKRLEALKGCLG